MIYKTQLNKLKNRRTCPPEGYAEAVNRKMTDNRRRTNNDLQNSTQKTKERAKRTPQNQSRGGGAGVEGVVVLSMIELRCFG
jgi:hypothetical protein